MKKIIISPELKSRLICASENGSIIAKDILSELKGKPENVLRGKVNYFASKKNKNTCSECTKIRITITACNKDITHKNFPDRNNPEAPWFKENRTEFTLSKFIEQFKNLSEYSQEQVDYFINSLSVDSRITLHMYDSMHHFEEVYNSESYALYAQYGDSSLHNSCMRYENIARNVADFYHNFAGAKIIVAKDKNNQVHGRAIVWENAKVIGSKNEINVSVLDRVYFTHDFIIKLIWKFAQQQGIHVRKTSNCSESEEAFTVLNTAEGSDWEIGQLVDLQLTFKVKASQWFKEGAPYMDTFYNVSLDEQLNPILSNYHLLPIVAICRNTNGYAAYSNSICPSCGMIHCLGKFHFCEVCEKEMFTDTPFGRVLNCKFKKYQGKNYPSTFFIGVKTSPLFSTFLSLNKLHTVTV